MKQLDTLDNNDKAIIKLEEVQVFVVVTPYKGTMGGSNECADTATNTCGLSLPTTCPSYSC